MADHTEDTLVSMTDTQLLDFCESMMKQGATDGSSPALTVGIGIDSSVHGWSMHT